MASVRIDNFGGLVLTKDQKKGPFWTAMKCQNCDIQSGSVDVAYSLDMANIVNLTGTVPRKKIHNLTGSTFLEWTQDVNVARSPLADNSSQRIYYTGNGVPQVTDASMATAGAAPYPALSFVLGIPVYPAIISATEVTASGTTAETRAYTYTFVSPWGEEGPPATPIQLTTHTTGARIRLHGIGVASRVYTNTVPIGVSVSVITLIAGTPGIVRLSLAAGGFNFDFRVGDRVYFVDRASPSYKPSGIYTVSAADPTGNGTVDLAMNISDTAAPAIAVLFRALPANRYNIVGASIDTPKAGQVTVFVDTTEGLRVGEDVLISGTSGVTGLNAQFTAQALNTSVPNTQPSFVVNLAATGAFVGSNTAVAARTAKHNTGETRVTGITFAGGVATATVETAAHMNVGDDLVIVGVLGAWQANGKRKLLSVTAPNTVTFALAAMSAYTGGGIAILNTPYPMLDQALNSVSVVGAGPYTVTIGFATTPIFSIGDHVLGYDIGGSVELNNVLLVDNVLTSSITCTCAFSPTAFTAGGKILRLWSQSRKRLYRTGTGNTGTAEFQLVAELPGTTGVYDDVVETAALGEVLPSDEWIPPPTDMHSILAHPSGFLMGMSGNIVAKSIPYQPHAWPLSLQQSLPSDIVGANVYGTTLVAMTEEIPYNVTGYSPDQMRVERQDVGEPCTSKRSVAATGLGVSYRGTSGIFLIGYQGSENATRNYLPPSLFLNAADTIAAFWGNKLVWIDAGTQDGYIFDPVREDKGLTEFHVDFLIYDLHVSPVDGKLYASYMDGTQPKRAPLFSIVTNPAKFTYWTQYILLPKPVSLAWLQVDWQWHLQSATMQAREDLLKRNVRSRPMRGRYAIDDAQIMDFEVNGDALEVASMPDRTVTIPTERYCFVTVLANAGNAVTETVVFQDYVVNGDPVGLAHPVESDTWQVKIEANAKVTAVSLAETQEELGES